MHILLLYNVICYKNIYLIFNMYKIVIYDKSKIYVDNYKCIDTFSSNEIVIQFSKEKLSLVGLNFSVKYITNNSLIVIGEIKSILWN